MHFETRTKRNGRRRCSSCCRQPGPIASAAAASRASLLWRLLKEKWQGSGETERLSFQSDWRACVSGPYYDRRVVTECDINNAGNIPTSRATPSFGRDLHPAVRHLVSSPAEKDTDRWVGQMFYFRFSVGYTSLRSFLCTPVGPSRYRRLIAVCGRGSRLPEIWDTNLNKNRRGLFEYQTVLCKRANLWPSFDYIQHIMFPIYSNTFLVS